MSLDISKLEAVIFDMDGVLFLSTNCHERAYAEALRSVGIDTFSYRAIAGMRTDEAMRKILTENNYEVTETAVNALVAKKRQKALELLEQAGKIREGTQELMARLVQKKYRLVLASSASPQTVALFLRKSGLEKAFEYVLDGSMVERAKPAPDIYLLAIQKLDLEPKQCLVVEDAKSGIEAALAAGANVLAITGTELREKLLAAGANEVVEELKKILS